MNRSHTAAEKERKKERTSKGTKAELSIVHVQRAVVKVSSLAQEVRLTTSRGPLPSSGLPRSLPEAGGSTRTTQQAASNSLKNLTSDSEGYRFYTTCLLGAYLYSYIITFDLATEGRQRKSAEPIRRIIVAITI